MPNIRLLDFVTFARSTFADRPFWLFVGLFLTFLAGATLGVRAASRGGTRRSGVYTTLAVLTLAIYAATAAWYAFQEQYVDFAEPTVTAISWLFDAGRPIYHALDSAERYSHMYGPMAFIVPGWILALLGPSIESSKVAGVAAGLSAQVVFYRLVRPAADARTALLLAGLFAGACLMFRHVSFWVRPDSFELLLVSLGLLAASSWRGPMAPIAVGLSTGLLVNLKFTGPLYGLPALVLLAVRFGPRWTAVVAATALATAVMPFVLFENVSLGNYLQWVRVSASNGVDLFILRQNVEWACFLLVPVAACLLAGRPAALAANTRRWLLAAFCVGLAGVTLAAAKPGGGPYHLLPFLPVVMYILALHIDHLREKFCTRIPFRSAHAAFVTTVGLVAFAQQAYFWWAATLDAGVEAVDDIERFASAHPRTRVAMGYTDNDERLTFARPVLVFRDSAYLIDAPAVQEYQMSGLELPAATLDALRRCDVGVWLLPRHGAPFKTRNNYPSTGYRPLFPEAFQRTFVEVYEHTGNTRFYQIWRCRTAVRRRTGLR